MNKLIAITAASLLSTAAWSNDIFRGNPDTMDTVLLDNATMNAKAEKGQGDFYGTSLEGWGGGATVSNAAAEKGAGNMYEYGSVILDVRPDLIRGQ